MKVYCTTCKTNSTELPDDAQLSPELSFTCRECCGPAPKRGIYPTSSTPQARYQRKLRMGLGAHKIIGPRGRPRKYRTAAQRLEAKRRQQRAWVSAKRQAKRAAVEKK